MNLDVNTREKETLDSRFPDWKRLTAREDVIVVYSDKFRGDICETAKSLQAATDFLKYVTSSKPTEFFCSRIVIGHNRATSMPNWSGQEGNRIYIPLADRYFEEDEFLDSCSHELVHPFFRASPLHRSNQWWGEAFCDFMRGPVKNVMGLDGRGWWIKKTQEARSNKQDRGGNVAGQLVLRAQKEERDLDDIADFIGRFIDDREGIKIFVQGLYDRFSSRPMREEFRATEWIRDQEG